MQGHEGRRYLLAAATSGIGMALAHRLAKAGARLALAARDGERLAALGATLAVPIFPFDAQDAASADGAVSGAVAALGGLDGAVCLSGSLLLKPAHLTTPSEWSTTMLANATAAFSVLRAAVRPMMAAKAGTIVLMSSAAARIGLANHEAIAASKGAVEGLALAAAATYARHGIRVNCVAPGLTRTPLTSGLTRHEAQLKASTAMHPLGRIGEPDDVAATIAWLLSAEASWITGQVLAVDGGLSSLKLNPQG